MDQRVRMIGALTPNRKNSPPRSHARAPARSCALPALCSRACLEGNFALRRPSPPSNPPTSHPMPADMVRVCRSDERLRSPPPPAAPPQPVGATASGRSGSPPPPQPLQALALAPPPLASLTRCCLAVQRRASAAAWAGASRLVLPCRSNRKRENGVRSHPVCTATWASEPIKQARGAEDGPCASCDAVGGDDGASLANAKGGAVIAPTCAQNRAPGCC